MIPPGKYIGTVISHTYGHSSQKGTPNFEIPFEIEYNGEKFTVTKNLWLTEGSMGIARASLKAIGLNTDGTPEDFERQLNEMIANPMLFMGKQAQVTVIEEERQDGEGWVTKIGFINPIPTPPKGNEIKSLAKQLFDVKGTTKKNAVKKDDTTAKVVKHFEKPQKEDYPF